MSQLLKHANLSNVVSRIETVYEKHRKLVNLQSLD